MSFQFSRVDSLEPFTPKHPAPRGSEILSCCMFHDCISEKSNDNNNQQQQQQINYKNDEGLSAAFFNTGALVIKRVTRERSFSFTTEAQNKMIAKEQEMYRDGTSTLTWNELPKETYAKQNSTLLSSQNLSSKFIVGTSFTAAGPAITIRRVISSHVDIGIIYNQDQNLNLNLNSGGADYHYSSQDQNNNNNNNTSTPRNASSSAAAVAENDNNVSGVVDFSPRTGANSAIRGANLVGEDGLAHPHQNQSEIEQQLNTSLNANANIASSQNQQQEHQKPMFSLQNSNNNNNNNAQSSQQQQQEDYLSSQQQQHRYVVVGASLCELSDGRCALFTVSSHLTNVDLLKGTAASFEEKVQNFHQEKYQQQMYMQSQQQHQQQQNNNNNNIENLNFVDQTTGANKNKNVFIKPLEPPKPEKQEANYPLDAETSILELPNDCVSVEVQVATQSVLVRVSERKSHFQQNQNQQQQQPIHNSDNGPIAASSILCLALDSSGRPVGAASLRGRSLTPFSPQMAGVRALWRIKADDGSCAGNMRCSSPNGVLDEFVRRNYSSASPPKNATSSSSSRNNKKNNSNRRSKLFSSTNPNERASAAIISQNNEILSQLHKIICCCWVSTSVFSAANNYSSKNNNNNTNPNFSCLSVLLSAWKELAPDGTVGNISPFLPHHAANSASAAISGTTSSNKNQKSQIAEFAVCTVLLSQMVLADPSESLHGFQHRKVASFLFPSIFVESNSSSQNSSSGNQNQPQFVSMSAASIATSSFDTAGVSILNSDGTLLLIGAPNSRHAPCAGVSVAIVVVTVFEKTKSFSSGVDENQQDLLFFNMFDALNNNNDNENFFSAQQSATANSTCVVTFQARCNHSNSDTHHHTKPQIYFLNSSSSSSSAGEGGGGGKRSVVIFFPTCGCCSFVSDVLRVAPIVHAEPILGFGCINPLGSLGLRNSEKFPIVPHLCRSVFSPAPPSSSSSSSTSKQQHQAFFQQAQQIISSCNLSTTNNNNAYSSVPFMFAGLPLSCDSKSGSALSIIFSHVNPSPRSRLEITSSIQGLLSSSSNINNSNFSNNSNTSSTTSNSFSAVSRLVESLGAEAIFLIHQFRSLDLSSSSSSNSNNSNNVFLKKTGLLLMETYFKRVTLVVTICNNLFSKSPTDFHLFSATLIQLAKFSEVLLENFRDTFIGETEETGETTQTQPQNINISASSLLLHPQQQEEIRVRMEQTISSFVATSFCSAVSKLLQLGLVSIASRVVYCVGPYCAFLVDMVYPAAAQLYRDAGIEPSYASFLHDIENLISDQAREVLEKLAMVRKETIQAKNEEKLLKQINSNF